MAASASFLHLTNFLNFSGYTHSFTNAYGNLFINYYNGNYLFEPASAAINALSSLKEETASVTASDGIATSDAATIHFIFKGVDDGPEIAVSGSQALAIKVGVEDATQQDTGYRITVADSDTEVTETSHTMTLTGDYADKFLVKPVDVSAGVFGLYLKANTIFSDIDSGTREASVTATNGGLQSNTASISFFVDASPVVLITGSSAEHLIVSGRPLLASLNTGYTLLTEDSDGITGNTKVVFKDTGGNDVSSLFDVDAFDGSISLNAGSILTESLLVKVEFTDDEGNTVISSEQMDIQVSPGSSVSIDGVLSTNMRIRPDITGIADQHESFPDYNYTWEKGSLDASGDFIPEGFSSSSETLVLSHSTYGGKYLRLTVGYTDQAGESRSLNIISDNPVNFSPSLDDEIISYMEDSGTADPSGSFDASDKDTGNNLTYEVKDSVADTSEKGFTHRWDATYGKLFYNHDTGAYIFKPDEDAIDPLSATVSQYTDIFVTDGIATTAGELGIKIIGVADAQGEGSISRDERSDIGQNEESFIYTGNYGEFEIENQNSFASDIL